jgi:hypothetical protein
VEKDRTRQRAQPRMAVTTPGMALLFGADGEDLFVPDLYLYAEGRANVAALDDGAGDPDVAGEVGGFERIEKRAAARVADEWMGGVAVVVILEKFAEIGDVFESAVTVSGFTRKGPVAGGRSGRAGRKANERRGNVFAGDGAANEKIERRPGLGKIGDVADDRIIFVGVGKQGIGIRGRRGHFNLRGGVDAGRFGASLQAREPMRGQEESKAENHHAQDQREKWITVTNRRRGGDARDGGHVGLKARGGCGRLWHKRNPKQVPKNRPMWKGNTAAREEKRG